MERAKGKWKEPREKWKEPREKWKEPREKWKEPREKWKEPNRKFIKFTDLNTDVSNKMINEIEKIFLNRQQSSMSGTSAHLEMAPPYRHQLFMKNAQYKDAAVAMLLYKKGDDFYFPLIRRTSGNPNDKHSGQISFPGGKLDQSDSGFCDCAVRELKEELGIENMNIRQLGELSELLIPVSNYRVRPFIFSTVENPVFYPQESEVQYVLEVKLAEFLNSVNIETGEVFLDNGIRLPDIPYFHLNDHKIWGATAMILNEFKNVCRNIKTNHLEQR